MHTAHPLHRNVPKNAFGPAAWLVGRFRRTARLGARTLAAAAVLGVGCVDPEAEPRLVVGEIAAARCSPDSTGCLVDGDHSAVVEGDGPQVVTLTLDPELSLCVVPEPEIVAWTGTIGFLTPSSDAFEVRATPCEPTDEGESCDVLDEEPVKLWLVALAENGGPVCRALRPADFVESE